MCECVCECMCVCVCFVCMYLCVFVCACVCVFMYTSVCVCVCKTYFELLSVSLGDLELITAGEVKIHTHTQDNIQSRVHTEIIHLSIWAEGREFGCERREEWTSPSLQRLSTDTKFR